MCCFSPETSYILNNDVYNSIVQQHQITAALTSINTTKSIKKCLKKSKNNLKLRKMPIIKRNQNIIPKYFHPIISTANDLSTTTIKIFSTNFNDHDDSELVNISPSSSSNVIKLKYFIDKIIQPYSNTISLSKQTIQIICISRKI